MILSVDCPKIINMFIKLYFEAVKSKTSQSQSTESLTESDFIPKRKYTEEEVEAATRIKAIFRGYITRKRLVSVWESHTACGVWGVMSKKIGRFTPRESVSLVHHQFHFQCQPNKPIALAPQVADICHTTSSNNLTCPVITIQT